MSFGKQRDSDFILFWFQERIQGIKEGANQKVELVTLIKPQLRLSLLSQLVRAGWVASQD